MFAPGSGSDSLRLVSTEARRPLNLLGEDSSGPRIVTSYPLRRGPGSDDTVRFMWMRWTINGRWIGFPVKF
jgi:hypothetical protein